MILIGIQNLSKTRNGNLINNFIDMKKIIYTLLISLTIFLVNCAEDYQPAPYGSDDGKAPGKVENVTVRNIHGGAVLKYSIPDNVDLQYIQAVFTNTRNEEQTVRASFYTDSLVVEGLGNTDKREVKLFAVNKFERQSEPTIVEIEPLIPTVVETQKSLLVTESFGGFFLDFENVERDALSFYIYKWVEQENDYEILDVYTSAKNEGQFIVKGLEHKLTKLAIFVRDKWGNTSDTLYSEITPWKESLLDKNKFRLTKVMDDVSWDFHEGYHTRLWDNVIGGWNWGHTDYPIPFPHAFTIDLNTSVRLSQFRFWQRLDNNSLLYAHGAPKQLRLWGCEDGKDVQNADNWVLLFDGEMKKPSGKKFGEPLTQEDLEEAQRGHVFTLDQNVPFIRYFRFQSLASWSGMETSVMTEITLWGAYENEE